MLEGFVGQFSRSQPLNRIGNAPTVIVVRNPFNNIQIIGKNVFGCGTETTPNIRLKCIRKCVKSEVENGKKEEEKIQ